jgi:5-formyltetrahydrofolate cyclo-ligase
VWAALSDAGVARFPGARGRIPNFTGAEAAARLLASTPEWAAAQVLKCNPDAPQLPVRVLALEHGKLVRMAVPRLREDRPFLTLDPERLAVPPRKAASIGGSAEHGIPTPVEELGHVDLVVCGTVAVNADGVRIGKGGGYSDLEWALAAALGLVDERTVVATTVHPIQVVDEDLPEAEHDFRVDLVVTPDDVVRCPGGHRPARVLWEHLDDERVASIPVLARLRSSG